MTTPNRSVRVRVAIALVVGHIAGSYATEIYDAIDNYGEGVTLRERLVAPLHNLPSLVWSTVQQLRHQVNYSKENLVTWWVLYAFPVAVCLVVGLTVWKRPAPGVSPSGFEPLPAREGNRNDKI